MEFSEKTILITGASSGIGFELAKLFAKESCKIALLARREDKLNALADDLRKSGSVILPLKCDVTDKTQVNESTKFIKDKFGGIDVAILNAGVSFRNPIEEFNVENAELTYKVNVLSFIYFIENLLHDFKERKNGVIVGVSSLADTRGFPGSGIYCSSKAAATLLLESWRIELKKYNVKIITVKPGFVRTPMTAKNRFKMPFLMNPDKAAKIIFNGIKKEKSVIEFPLPTVLGAKILKLLPNKLFDLFALTAASK